MKPLEPKSIILIGASTGGPSLIQEIIIALPQLNNTSIVVAQHMSEEFIFSFVRRLNELSNNPIKVVSDNMQLQSNYIYFCNKNTQVCEKNLELIFSVSELSGNFSYNPNISTVFSSFALLSNKKIMAFILTGIGDDGIVGAKKLYESGARVITQDHCSAIVDGMPYRARESINGIEVHSNEEIIQIILGASRDV